MTTRDHAPGDGTSWWAAVAASNTRYAIVQGGVVVGIVVLPADQVPSFSLGQTAVASNTLKVGDKA